MLTLIHLLSLQLNPRWVTSSHWSTPLHDIICLFAILLTDATEPLWVCSLGQVPFGDSETVFGVGFHRQWRTPVLHGQWEGGGGHVHEHGPGTFPAGERRKCVAWVGRLQHHLRKLNLSFYRKAKNMSVSLKEVSWVSRWISDINTHTHICLM